MIYREMLNFHESICNIKFVCFVNKELYICNDLFYGLKIPLVLNTYKNVDESYFLKIRPRE